MRNLLQRLLVEDLTGFEPQIIDMLAPITIVGMSVETTLKRIYRDVPALGREFKALKQKHPIPNLQKPWGFAAVSRGYDPATGAITYMMGDVVTAAENIPECMHAFADSSHHVCHLPGTAKEPPGLGPGHCQRQGLRLHGLDARVRLPTCRRDRRLRVS